MGIQAWSEDTILVDLSGEPEMGNELVKVAEIMCDRGDCDVVIDFSGVDIVTSSSLSKLLNLRKKLFNVGHKLVLCSVSAATQGIFMISGLESNFEFVNDKSEVLTSL